MTDTVDFLLPSLGADMETGTVVRWSVQPGDEVRRGDVALIVETDKGEIDVEVWDAGVVEELLVPPGVEVPVGTPLARLRSHGGASSHERVRAAAPLPDAPAVPVEPAARGSPHDPGGGSSPLARRLAAERGLAVATLVGSGPGGAVVARDVPDPSDGPTEAVAPAAAMRRAIASSVSRANREIPTYHLASEIDLDRALGWLERTNPERPADGRILPAAVLLAAVARALDRHGIVNGWWEGDAFRPADGVDLGVAVSLRGGGLVVPVIADAQALEPGELMARLRDLVGRARTGRLRASEVSGASATVTNLGDRGADVVHGVIHPPQVALVGIGRIAERPAVVDGELVARRRATFSLAADHRASDGDAGARFLRSVDRLLQTPEEL